MVAYSLWFLSGNLIFSFIITFFFLDWVVFLGVSQINACFTSANVTLSFVLNSAVHKI